MDQELVEAIITFDTAVWLGIFSAGSEFRNPDEKLVEEIENQLIEDGLTVKRLTKDEKKLAARKRVPNMLNVLIKEKMRLHVSLL